MSTLPLNSLEPRSESGSGIVRLDFIGDRVVIYLMFLAGTLGVVESFISGTTTACFVPHNVSSRQGEYVNIFCSHFLPKTVNLPYFVIVRGIIVLVPHYVWVLWNEGYFRYFFQAASQLNVCRDPETGRYYDESVQLVKYLKERYKSTCNCNGCCCCTCSRPLEVTYWLKLFFQEILLIILTVLASKPFYEINCFSVTSPAKTFQCRNDSSFSQDSPIMLPVECATYSFLFTCIPSIFDLVIVIIAGLTLVFQFTWVTFLPHARISLKVVEDAAQFSFQSSLPHKYFQHFQCALIHAWKNLEFMLLVLERSSPGYSDLLRDMLIQEEIQRLRKECIIFLQNNEPAKEEIIGTLPNVIYENLPTAVTNELQLVDNIVNEYQLLIITISFGPCTYYTISSKFKLQDRLPKVLAINFEEHIREVTEARAEGTHVESVQVPADIYRRDRKTVEDFHARVKQLTESNKYSRLICIIGPSKRVERRRVLRLYKRIRDTPTPNIPRVFISVCPSKLSEYKHPNISDHTSLEQNATCGTAAISWTFAVIQQQSLTEAVQPLLVGALKQIPAEAVKQLLAEAVQRLLAGALQQLPAKAVKQLLTEALQQLPEGAVKEGGKQPLQKEQQLAEALKQLPAKAGQQLLAGALQQLSTAAVQQLLAGAVQQLLAGALQQLPEGPRQQLLAGAVLAGWEQPLAGALQQLPAEAGQQLLAGASQQLPAGEIKQLLAGALQQLPAEEIKQLVAGAPLAAELPAGAEQQLLVKAVQQLLERAVQQQHA